MGVSDGDTITVLHNGKAERIRLHGVDSPERRQALGKRAKQFTSRVVYGKTVTVRDLAISNMWKVAALVEVLERLKRD